MSNWWTQSYVEGGSRSYEPPPSAQYFGQSQDYKPEEPADQVSLKFWYYMLSFCYCFSSWPTVFSRVQETNF